VAERCLHTAEAGGSIPSAPRWLYVCLAAWLLATVGCTARPGTVPADTADAAAAAGTGEYIIGPGDKLNIVVYENPQLSVSLPVRPDGRISMPLVPDVVAAGQTPTALGRTLEQRLAKYEKDTNVTVMVTDFFGPFDRQIRVIGEATQPEAITYREHMSLLDVMILTKGLTRFAAGNRSVIVRKTADGQAVRINVRLSDLINDGDLSQNIEMQPGDTLIIPQTWF
jgi:polysaccharide biosynthesis/export protein